MNTHLDDEAGCHDDGNEDNINVERNVRDTLVAIDNYPYEHDMSSDDDQMKEETEEKGVLATQETPHRGDPHLLNLELSPQSAEANSRSFAFYDLEGEGRPTARWTLSLNDGPQQSYAAQKHCEWKISSTRDSKHSVYVVPLLCVMYQKYYDARAIDFDPDLYLSLRLSRSQAGNVCQKYAHRERE